MSGACCFCGPPCGVAAGGGVIVETEDGAPDGPGGETADLCIRGTPAGEMACRLLFREIGEGVEEGNKSRYPASGVTVCVYEEAEFESREVRGEWLSTVLAMRWMTVAGCIAAGGEGWTTWGMAERPCFDVVSAMLPDEVDALRWMTPLTGVLAADTRSAVDVRCVDGTGLAPEAALVADGKSGPAMVPVRTPVRSAVGGSPLAVRMMGCQSTWIAALPCAGARPWMSAARTEAGSSEACAGVTSVNAAAFEKVS